MNQSPFQAPQPKGRGPRRCTPRILGFGGHLWSCVGELEGSRKWGSALQGHLQILTHPKPTLRQCEVFSLFPTYEPSS